MAAGSGARDRRRCDVHLEIRWSRALSVLDFKLPERETAIEAKASLTGLDVDVSGEVATALWQKRNGCLFANCASQFPHSVPRVARG